MAGEPLPYWKTRNRRADFPQLPHPDGYNEYVGRNPTGRISKMIGRRNIVGTLDQIDRAVEAFDLYREYLGRESVQPPPPPLRSGLRRTLKFDHRMREMIEKFDAGLTLTQIEYRFLLTFYGLFARLGEIVGQPYGLLNRDVNQRYAKLVAMGREQGFTQGLLDGYGMMVEELLGRFC